MSDAIRIFVGCSANGEDAEAQAMLEYTIRHYASEPVEITWMILSRDPSSPWYSNPPHGWNTTSWATPFSAFRWAIPEVCNFEGRAIYLDVDMILRDDIAKLWRQTIPEGKALLAKNNKWYCVILYDCALVKGRIPPLDRLRREVKLYRQVRESLDSITAVFEGNWNCHDGEKYKNLFDPDIKILHFTKVETQPHMRYAFPRLRKEGRKHWGEYLATCGLQHARGDVAPLVEKIWKDAQQAGYTADKYLKDLVPFGPYNSVRGGRAA